MNLNAEQKISACRIVLGRTNPFFSYLFRFLKTEKVLGLQYGTMETNGETIFYDQQFVDSLEIPEICFCLIHEISHIIFKHGLRIGFRDPDKWRRAIDYAVNAVGVANQGKWVKPIPDILYDEKYINWSAEDIYNDLPDHEKRQPFCQHGYGKHGNILPSDTQDAWISRIQAAAEFAKNRGSLPGALEWLVETLTKPKINWRVQFRRFTNHFKQDDYSWNRLNRMYIHLGISLPSTYSLHLGPVLLFIDTSSSMTYDEQKKMLAEIQSIRRSYSMDLHLICCDTKIQSHVVLKKGQPLTTIKCRGGGGTDFVPAFDYIKEKKIKPTYIIYMTDGHGTYPKVAPKYPVLWLLTKNHKKPPFGKQIIVED